ncbi:hypothetical protein B0H16DRAFT_1480652 [Mycena metata]|uniref:Uncharacterized protein n=1 Tax=Mycena metata TaxID=1033252 RepID=A0AAD7H2T4_9AGAR|nr:hypothetical protein B0H16DRAFT_1480652 [Mycena metata]
MAASWTYVSLQMARALTLDLLKQISRRVYMPSRVEEPSHTRLKFFHSSSTQENVLTCLIGIDMMPQRLDVIYCTSEVDHAITAGYSACTATHQQKSSDSHFA